MYRRGIDARAVCRDGDGRVLLVTDDEGRAALPGGPVGHGEHPADAAARWTGVQTGAALTVRQPLRVVTDLHRDRPSRLATVWQHRDVVVFAGELRGAAAPAGVWVAETDLGSVRTARATAAALGLPTDLPARPRRVSWTVMPARDGRRQRFAAYGHAVDPADRVLLTLIADGFPGAGLWHLPGGGTDFGETAEAGLRREIVEETAQHVEVGALLRVSHRHQTRGHDGRAVDWHGVRAVFAVRVSRPTVPRVLERGGSTAAAAWFTVAEALELGLTEVAHEALSRP